jgi:hypothetical protein
MIVAMTCLPELHGVKCSIVTRSYNTLDGEELHGCSRRAVWHMTCPRLGDGFACSYVCDRHGRRFAKRGDLLLSEIPGVAVRRSVLGGVRAV